MSDVDIKRDGVVDFSNLRSMALYLKVFDEAEMIRNDQHERPQ